MSLSASSHAGINREKCFISRIMSCPSVCPHVSARLPLDRFSCILILRTLMKMCGEAPDLVKSGQKYLAPYVET